MSSLKFNTIIKNATIYNGTGEESYCADVGICRDQIAAIGNLNADGANVVEAQGLSLMPGIIDVHTHYDAQITWDPTLSPSPLNHFERLPLVMVGESAGIRILIAII